VLAVIRAAMGDRGPFAPPSDNLYCSGFPQGTTEEDVKLIFGKIAEVVQTRVMQANNGQACSALVRFPSIEVALQVVEACETQQGYLEGCGEPISVRFANPKGSGKGDKGFDKGGYGGYGKAGYGGGKGAGPYGGKGKGKGSSDTAPNDNLYVQQMPGDTNPEEMLTVFSQYGTVVDTKVLHTDGYHTTGLVRYASIAEATEVINNLAGNLPQGFERCKEPLIIRYADPPKWLQEKGGGSWGGDDWGGSWGGSASAGKWRPTPAGPFSMKTVVKGFQTAGCLPGADTEFVEVFVRGLPADAEDLDLYRLFGCFGAIAPRGVRVMTHPDGTSRGFGFVNFLDPVGAELAITALDNTLMPDGKTRLTVQPKGPGKKEAEAPAWVPTKAIEDQEANTSAALARLLAPGPSPQAIHAAQAAAAMRMVAPGGKPSFM